MDKPEMSLAQDFICQLYGVGEAEAQQIEAALVPDEADAESDEMLTPGDLRARLAAKSFFFGAAEDPRPTLEETVMLRDEYGLVNVGIDTLRYGIAIAAWRYRHSFIKMTPNKRHDTLLEVTEHINDLLWVFPRLGPDLMEGIKQTDFFNVLFQLRMNAERMLDANQPFVDKGKKQQPYTGDRLRELIITLSGIFCNAAGRLHRKYTWDDLNSKRTGEFVEFVVLVCQIVGVKKSRSIIGKRICELHASDDLPARRWVINPSIPL